MRKKILIGLLSMTILGLGAGAHLLNRSSAQDPPKKAEPAEKKSDDLFDQLKKALDEKKESQGVPTAEPPMPLAPLTSPPAVNPTLPAPAPSPVPAPMATPPGLPALPPMGTSSSTPPVAVPPPVTSTPTDAPKPIFPSKAVEPSTGLKPIQSTLPPATATTPPASAKPQDLYIPQQATKPSAEPMPAPATLPVQRVAEPPPPPTVQVTSLQLKDSPWSLHVEMVNGQTIVTAVVNKKHQFKIVCQTLDLQTGKNTLRATGKVQISGEMMNGSCDHLAIPLMEDRLVLEGGAQVAIQKVSANVSTDKAASFELKGSTLDLRIGELQSSKLLQAAWAPSNSAPTSRDTAGVEGRAVSRTSTNVDGKQWTPYGVLRRVEAKVGNAYRLETNTGTSIDVAAREGGSLDEYVGRTISVLGRMEMVDGSMKLRVTHIALP